MKFFLRFLCFWAGYGVAIIEYRMSLLTDALGRGEIDIDTYIVRRNDLAIEKKTAKDDEARWSQALAALAIQP